MRSTFTSKYKDEELRIFEYFVPEDNYCFPMKGDLPIDGKRTNARQDKLGVGAELDWEPIQSACHNYIHTGEREMKDKEGEVLGNLGANCSGSASCGSSCQQAGNMQKLVYGRPGSQKTYGTAHAHTSQGCHF